MSLVPHPAQQRTVMQTTWRMVPLTTCRWQLLIRRYQRVLSHLLRCEVCTPTPTTTMPPTRYAAASPAAKK